MNRSRFAVLGLCVVLAACGEKFVAHGGSGDNGGASSAGHGGDVNTVGEAGSGAEVGAGDAGNETAGHGGAPASGGTGGLLGNPGGGATGLSGTGGALAEPMLPQAGLLLWLRADRGIQQKDGHVQVWQDQSGEQTNASQAAVNLRPVYLAEGFNGRPTLEFDGQRQFLKFAEGFGDFSNGLAGLIVAKPTKSECASMLEFSNGSEIDDVALGMWQNKWTYEVESPFIQAGDVDAERFTLYSVNHRVTGAADLRIGGSVISMLDMPLPIVPSSGVRLNNFVGHTLYAGCEYFTGQISEIILYGRTLSRSELNEIEEYLDAHWALREQDSPTPEP